MSLVHNLSNLSVECQEIAISAVKNLDPKFSYLLSIAKFWKVHLYDEAKRKWKNSEHEGPIYLYVVNNDTSEQSVVMLLHNHLSRENFRFQFSKKTEARIIEDKATMHCTRK